jgi:hypothetical protein
MTTCPDIRIRVAVLYTFLGVLVVFDIAFVQQFAMRRGGHRHHVKGLVVNQTRVYLVGKLIDKAHYL